LQLAISAQEARFLSTQQSQRQWMCTQPGHLSPVLRLSATWINAVRISTNKCTRIRGIETQRFTRFNPVCLNRHTGRRLRVGFESKQVVGISIFNLALGIQLNNTKKYILFAANYSKAQSDMLNMFVLLSKPLLLRSPQKNTANNGKVGSTKRGDSNANRRLTWETFMSLRLQNGCIYLYLLNAQCDVRTNLTLLYRAQIFFFQGEGALMQ